MGTGEVDPKRTYPFNVLDELGNETGEVVEVETLETLPSGDTLVEDEDGNVYMSLQGVQKLGGVRIADGDEYHEFDPETGADYAEEVESAEALEEPSEDFVDPADVPAGEGEGDGDEGVEDPENPDSAQPVNPEPGYDYIGEGNDPAAGPTDGASEAAEEDRLAQEDEKYGNTPAQRAKKPSTSRADTKN